MRGHQQLRIGEWYRTSGAGHCRLNSNTVLHIHTQVTDTLATNHDNNKRVNAFTLSRMHCYN